MPFLHLFHLIIALAAEDRLPAVYQARFWVEAGGLMSYGVDRMAAHRQATCYALGLEVPAVGTRRRGDRMKRRDFICAARRAATWSVAARAQQGERRL
jgi:hypothetical protein